MSYGAGCTHSSDLVLLWLWYRVAARALIRPLAWEPPYATDAALKRQKKKKKKRNSEGLIPCLQPLQEARLDGALPAGRKLTGGLKDGTHPFTGSSCRPCVYFVVVIHFCQERIKGRKGKRDFFPNLTFTHGGGTTYR